MRLSMSLLRRSLAVLLLLLVSVSTHWGYSVLTHEQIVDVLWTDGIQPLLLRRFPNSTEEDIRKAHGFSAANISAILSTTFAAAILSKHSFATRPT